MTRLHRLLSQVLYESSGNTSGQAWVWTPVCGSASAKFLGCLLPLDSGEGVKGGVVRTTRSHSKFLFIAVGLRFVHLKFYA